MEARGSILETADWSDGKTGERSWGQLELLERTVFNMTRRARENDDRAEETSGAFSASEVSWIALSEQALIEIKFSEVRRMSDRKQIAAGARRDSLRRSQIWTARCM